MLGKLFKYEMKATARFYLPMLPVILFLAIINKMLFIFLPDNPIINAIRFISVSAQVLLIFAAFIISFIIMIQRFYKSLLGEEGYLSFTLPVSATNHIVNKLLVSCIWTIVTFIVCAVSVFLLIPDYSWISTFFGEFSTLRSQFETILHINFWFFAIEIVFAALIAILSSTLMIYASLCLGHLAKSNRILVSFGAFFVLSTISQAISTIVLSILGYSFFEASSTLEAGTISTLLLTQIGIGLVLSVAYFIVSNIILSKHLNLE
ncbi:hypothetical protein RBG61_04830 [Paludicola sp. MB14-C6]|uniref:hypothetical protein n=1 Tax=Paludihabitans sp. MB14-C6 TaxID=3070656 RepID=UPI0027DE018E|nr:hypothetical protein [Paludicola sp. MB14-C6]WMJ23998.1 hypothetical protein RBG61_04830 [Paludicola sp. MB14-C6]